MRVFLSVIALGLAAVLQTGCSTSTTLSTACGGNNFEEVTLKPGCSTICMAEPCKVFFQMPPGESDYLVRGYGTDIGTYPAGEMVFLGSYWTGNHIFKVEGASVPIARVTVLGRAE